MSPANNRPNGDSAIIGAIIDECVVGPTRFELVTSRLSAGRSDQLSYGPNARMYPITATGLCQQEFAFRLRLILNMNYF